VIAQGMAEVIAELRRHTVLPRGGEAFGGEVVRVIEEYPDTAAELAEMIESSDLPKAIGVVWLQRLLRRGRKYRMKVFAGAEEFEVKHQGQGLALTIPGVFRWCPSPGPHGCEGLVLPRAHRRSVRLPAGLSILPIGHRSLLVPARYRQLREWVGYGRMVEAKQAVKTALEFVNFLFYGNNELEVQNDVCTSKGDL
jgi:hypothetical protein